MIGIGLERSLIIMSQSSSVYDLTVVCLEDCDLVKSYSDKIKLDFLINQIFTKVFSRFKFN